jgi:hypothetical protein
LKVRSPLGHDQRIEVGLVEDPDAPGPVVRTAAGLRLTLANALDTYDVVYASADERASWHVPARPFGGVPA